MISAAEALLLDQAEVSDEDRAQARAMIAKLDEHVRKHMAFGGPAPLEVPFREMSKPASQVLAYVMKRFKWNVSLTLIAEQPRFQGGQPTPHHWVIQMVPMVEVYDALLADFDIEPKPQLM